jgi:ankyrin repeat protein
MASSDIHDRHSLRIILPRRLTAEPSPDKRLRKRSLSNQSSISPISTRHSLQPSRSSSFHRRLGSVIDIGTNSSDGNDDDDDWDDSISMRQNYRFGSQTIRMRRRSSHYSRVHQQQLLASDKHDGFVIPMTNERFTAVTVTTPPSNDLRGQTLLHLASRLGHDEILRLLICETSQASMLMDKRGQTPLLTAIEAGSTNSATLLMESDPRSITISDNNGSNVFHYACEHCNDVVLNRAIALLKRLNSSSDRIRVSFSE